MATIGELMTAVRGLRNALHERLDDAVSNRVFTALRLRHSQAVVQARREVELPPMPSPRAGYDPAIVALDAATLAVTTASATDEPAMLASLLKAGAALDKVERLP